MKKHVHHIIPRHMGGTDHEDNLIELSIEEHAEEHRILWLVHGKKADFIAWQMLSGRKITEQDRIELSKEGFKKFLLDPVRKNAWIEKIKVKRTEQIITDSHKAAISRSLKKAYKEGRASYKPIDKQLLRNNYQKNKHKLDAGRKSSKKWQEAVRSEATKNKKIASDPRTTAVTIDGVKYSSMNQAKLAGYTRSQILEEVKRQKG